MYQNDDANLLYRYRDFWAGVDKESITILLFLSID